MDRTDPANSDILLKKALQAHAEGRLDDAAAIYRQLLQQYPLHTDLLNVMGTLELQRGNANKASMLLARSLGINPNQTTVLHHRAVALQNLGKTAEALDCYDKALTLDPSNVEFLQCRGRLLLDVNRVTEAVGVFSALIAMKPDCADFHYNLATVFLRLGRHQEALQGFDRAIALNPNAANAHINRAIVYFQANRLAEALADLDRAVELTPGNADAHSERGDVLRALGRPEDALAAYQEALKLAPNNADMHYGCGNVLYDLNRKQEALDRYNAAISINPRYGEAYNNRGNVQIDLGRPEEALASLDRAIALNPKNAQAFANRGNVLRELNRPKEALISFDRAIAANAAYAEAYANKAVALLHLGEFAEGWKLYEWRWKCEHRREAFQRFAADVVRQFTEKQWAGEPLSGRRVLIHAEQGLGDTIQFCRYIPMVYAAGGEVVVEAPKTLLPLLQTLKGRYAFIEAGGTLPAFDLHCPMMSLPLAFSTSLQTVPADVPYLFVDPDKRTKWHEILGPKTGSRIGIAWSGNPAHTNDRNRSVALAQLAPLFALPFEFHVLQKDVRAEDEAALNGFANLHRHDGTLEDFADTAALVEAMDLTISVDTSVAHLAGALDRPLWLLLPFVSEWRWLYERDDSPWYPSAELFRQKTRGDWQGVVATLAERLKGLMA